MKLKVESYRNQSTNIYEVPLYKEKNYIYLNNYMMMLTQIVTLEC